MKSHTSTFRSVTATSFRRCHAVVGRRPLLARACQYGSLFVLFYLLSVHRLDPDFGWHLQAGNYIRAHGIPAHDIFTYTAPHFPWIDHEWGNDVIVSLLYGWGGYGLVAVLYAGLWSAGLLIAGTRARLGVLLVAALAVLPYAGIRPVAWTVFFLAITLRALASKRRWPVWILPLLFVVWANLHAGFIIGLIIIAYSAVYRRRPRLFAVAALAGLATFVNAYGAHLYVEVGRTLFDPSLHRQVAEWAPLSFWSLVDIFIVVWGAGGLLFERPTLWAWLRPSVPLLLAAFSANRNVPLFVVAAVAECNRYVGTALQNLKQHGSPKLQRSRWPVAGLLVVLACLAARPYVWPLNADRTTTYPVQAVAYLRSGGCAGGQLFNDYNYGGYLIWQLPGRSVYIDGRMPSWKDNSGQKYMTHYYWLLAHPAQYQAEFRRYGIGCALLRRDERDTPLINQLVRDGWRPTVQTNYSVLLLVPKQK